MSKLIIAVLIIMSLLLTGCANPKNIDGVTYSTYGLFNKDDMKNPNIHYRLVWGNVIWGVVLVETVVAPLYFFGFSIWEPIGHESNIKGELVE